MLSRDGHVCIYLFMHTPFHPPVLVSKTTFCITSCHSVTLPRDPPLPAPLPFSPTYPSSLKSTTSNSNPFDSTTCPLVLPGSSNASVYNPFPSCT